MKKSSLFIAALALTLGMTAISQNATAQIGIAPITEPTTPDSDKANCISAADMTQIAQDFKQFASLSGKEYCFDGSQNSYLLAGINYIRKVQFTQPMANSPDELFTGKFASSWNTYLTRLIKTFKIESTCPQGAIAYVQSFFHQNTMHVCPMALTNAFTPLDLASVFMHEARHIEGYGHVTCAQGPRAGLQGACDKKISDAGSYAVTVETYAQLGQYGKDIHPAFRAIAQASSLIYAAEAFQVPVRINQEEAFLALTADKKIHHISSDLKAVREVGVTAQVGHIAKSKMGLMFIPENKNQPMTRIFPNGEIQAATIEYNDLSAVARANVVDYYFAWTWNARVDKNKVTFFCDKRQRPTQSSVVNFSGGQALSVVYPEGYSPDKNYAFVTTTNGLVKISCEGMQGKIAASSDLQIDADLKRVHKANATTIGLTNDGEIVQLGRSPVRVDLGLRDIVDVSSYSRATFFDAK
jgi:hypothetical protein